MGQYVGLDVSLKDTKLHVLDEAGNRVWRGRCATDAVAIAAAVRRYAPNAMRIGLETGPLTTWLWTALRAEGLPMICLDARHAKKALDMKVNKTDANDAEGLAHLVRAGWYREVRVKGRSAMLAKALLGARSQLLSISVALENQIRGILKTFGRIVPKGAGGLFDVGEVILVGSLRPIRTARETLGGRTLERPSCGGSMPTAETTLFPAYSVRSRRPLTSSARLDNEANLEAGSL